jgi:regulator of replication initiation timing
VTKNEVFTKEKEKLTNIFLEVEPSKRQLVEGLIDDAAFLKAENHRLKLLLRETGMIQIHPSQRHLQKPTEAARQYLKNVNSYAVIIKTLNGVLAKGIIEDEDDLSEFEDE